MIVNAHNVCHVIDHEIIRRTGVRLSERNQFPNRIMFYFEIYRKPTRFTKNMKSYETAVKHNNITPFIDVS